MLYAVSSIVLARSGAVVTDLTIPTPGAYQFEALVSSWVGMIAPFMSIVMVMFTWQSKRIASNVPAGTVTDSVPTALQAIEVSFLLGTSTPLTTGLPSMVRAWVHMTPGLTTAGRVTPVLAVV